MEKILILLAFWFIRSLLKGKFSKKDTNAPQQPTQTVPNQPKKSLDDVLGDFMKEVKQKSHEKLKPVLSDHHKAEEDSGKKLDWQEISKSKIKKKDQLLKRSDYSKVSHRNSNIEVEKTKEVLEVQSDNIEVDLEKAVIYNEILSRKYFSI